MRWRRRLRAEIVRRLQNARAEELLPEPIDRDAGEQRVRAIDDPPRQTETVSRQLWRHRRKERGGRRLELLARLVVHPAEQEMRLGFRIAALFQHHRRVRAQFDVAMLDARAGERSRERLIARVTLHEVVQLQRVRLGGRELRAILRRRRSNGRPCRRDARFFLGDDAVENAKVGNGAVDPLLAFLAGADRDRRPCSSRSPSAPARSSNPANRTIRARSPTWCRSRKTRSRSPFCRRHR